MSGHGWLVVIGVGAFLAFFALLAYVMVEESPGREYRARYLAPGRQRDPGWGGAGGDGDGFGSGDGGGSAGGDCGGGDGGGGDG